MRSQQLGLDGRRKQIAPTAINPAAKQGGMHLFSPTGFLDGTWWHRSYWVYGTGFAEGAGGWPQAGKWVHGARIIAMGETMLYGYGRQPTYLKWTTPLKYHLFAATKQPKHVVPKRPAGAKAPRRRRRPAPRRLLYAWSKEIPFHVRAMVLADKTLFVAGPPNTLPDEDAIFTKPHDPGHVARLAEQVACMEGKRGGVLWAVSGADGKKLCEVKLDAPPHLGRPGRRRRKTLHDNRRRQGPLLRGHALAQTPPGSTRGRWKYFSRCALRKAPAASQVRPTPAARGRS